jgi:hypothetical protein
MATIITQVGAGFVQHAGASANSTANHIRDMVQRCDTGNTDAHTAGDTAASYVATLRSRPFYFAGLLNKSGVMAGCLMAQAVAAGVVTVRVVKDYGDESLSLDVALDPETIEDTVMALLDGFSLSEMSAAQIELTDAPTIAAWQLYQIGLKPRDEQTS